MRKGSGTRGAKSTSPRDSPREEETANRRTVPYNTSDPVRPRYVAPLFPREPGRHTQPVTEDGGNRDEVEQSSADRQQYELRGRTAPVPLSSTGHLFAREVKVGDIVECAKFMNKYPDVLKEQHADRKYVHEAINARSLGDAESRELAESYIEKGLLVRNCSGRSTREITEYLSPLVHNNDEAWDQFDQDFDDIMAHVKKRVREIAKENKSADQPRYETVPVVEASEMQRHIGPAEIVQRISQMQVGSDYSSHQPPSHSDIASAPQPNPNVRHSAVTSQVITYVGGTRVEKKYTHPGLAPRRGSVHQRTEMQAPKQQEPAQVAPEPRHAGGQQVASEPRHAGGQRVAPEPRHAGVQRVAPKPRHTGGQQVAPEPWHAESQRVAPVNEPMDEDDSQFSLGRSPSLRGNEIPKAVAVEDRLDPNFKKMQPAAAGRFFRIGRVFKMFWHTEHTGHNLSQSKWTIVHLGTRIYSHIRIFAVVKEGHGYCWAVPINTYEGQGVRKRGLNQADIDAHAIIYSVGNNPVALFDEPRMRKEPIEVSRANESDDDCILDEASRINFAKPSTIEHNVTVRNIGMVTPESKAYLISYWNQHR